MSGEGALPTGPVGWDATLFAEAARRAASREPFVFCLVTAAELSAPRKAGAKMLVSPDGSIAGSVGGGPLEAVVIAQAVELLRGTSSSCSRSYALTADGSSAEPMSGSAPGLDGDALGMKCGGAVTVFFDVCRPATRILLFGGGHVGVRVAAVAGEAGLACVVVDDRPAFAARERFPRASDVRCADMAQSPLGGLEPGPDDFVVIATRCHALDERVLEAALASPARYVGLIGSRRKVALLLRALSRRSGQDPRGDPRLHAPIGLALSDKTPGEIAVAIVAEVLLLKNGGALAHSRLPQRTGEPRLRRV